MKINRLLLLTLVSGIIISCNKNDDNSDVEIVPPRDRGEVALENDQEILDYMSTHFYNYDDFENPTEDFDYKIRIDTIAGDNADKSPIIDSDLLETITVNNQGIDEKLYVLKIREGEGEAPHFTDSIFLSYQGQKLDGEVFDSRLSRGTWFNLVQYDIKGGNGAVQRFGNTYVKGFTSTALQLRGATGYSVNSDNTIKWNDDYGIALGIMPSGLGYFNGISQVGESYAPLVFQINLYNIDIADHDGDGIPSYMEDLDNDKDVFDDDTDGDGLSNHSDPDDDGDGKPTREEIEINEETGEIILTDSNNDGTPDYLDPDVF